MEMFEYNDPAGEKFVKQTQPAVASLEAFGPEEWAALREFAAERRYAPGAVILPAADPTPALTVIMEGEVLVQGDSGVTLGPGGIFGISRFLDPSATDVSARTEGGAAVLMLTPAAMTRMSAWRPRAVILLLGALGALLSRQLNDLGRSY